MGRNERHSSVSLGHGGKPSRGSDREVGFLTPVGTALSRRGTTGARCAQREPKLGVKSNRHVTFEADASSEPRMEHRCSQQRKRSDDRERESAALSRIAKLRIPSRTVWHPKEQRDVRCVLMQGGRRLARAAFIAEDEGRSSAFGSIPCAVFITEEDGTAVVPVINLGEYGMAADSGDTVLQVQLPHSENLIAVGSDEGDKHEQAARLQFSEQEQELLDMQKSEHRSWLHLFERGGECNDKIDKTQDMRPTEGSEVHSTCAQTEQRECVQCGVAFMPVQCTKHPAQLTR